MLLYEYYVFNSSRDDGKNIDPAIFRKVRGIDNVGEEYVGGITTIMTTLEFYKRSLEVAMSKIYSIKSDLDSANKRIQELTNGSNQVEA